MQNCLKNKMAKLLLLVCFALLTLTYVMACLQPGVPNISLNNIYAIIPHMILAILSISFAFGFLQCSNSDQCCGLLVCNPWANRCTKGGNWPLADANSGGKQIKRIYITMQKFVFLTFLVVIGLVLVTSKPQKSENTCSPQFGFCQVSSNCCHNLVCLTYAAKCVPKDGLIPPGEDTRPIGPPPYAPIK
ncbi:omega-conotoxin-like protein 1 [Vespula maculifrons]|uniref:Omega-conotoxin-like protein 1 n=1 Tax=Vespula maculifrons TaxID=7453 RepID=A0ABD2BCP8_VESMC